MKEKNVTDKILTHIRETLKSHNKDVDDFFEGIKEAKNYLKSHVEKEGLTKYVNETSSNTSTGMDERLLCHDFYDEVNRVEPSSEGKVEIAGETV